MCNKCNSTNSSNFGRVLDLDVIVTGCGGECYGTPILPNMTLRQVLDILIGNCGESSGGSKWYTGPDVPTFPANDGDFYLQSDGTVWEYDTADGWEQTGTNLKSIEWGKITGDINLQTDLINLINNITIDISQIPGQGLTYNSTENKIQIGDSETIPNYRIVRFAPNDISVLFCYEDASGGLLDSNKSRVAINPTSVSIQAGQDGDPVIFLSNAYARISGPNSVGSGVVECQSGGVTMTGGGLLVQMTGDSFLSSSTKFTFEAPTIVFGSGSAQTVQVNSKIEMMGQDRLILRSPNGSRFYVRVSDAGVLSTSPA